MLTKTLSKFMGMLLVLLGLGIAACTLGFASMVNPSLQGQAWWNAFWGGMENGNGWGSLGLGVFMVVMGGWLMVVPPPSESGQAVPSRDHGPRK